ncbi:unnamed protein product [Phyllotreta striolata]|uniref:Gamma-tubulin complex component n=1 Tax=Phyllotreta striolata TaxID=444603 RepID=A0A9N9U2R3_PHYSR|nr:unnamed protein product [Phyllotreta striolata]
MSEFKLEHIIAELRTTLRGKVNPNKLIEFVQKRNIPTSPGYSVEQKHLTRLLQHIPDQNAFMVKYNDLKDKNVDSLECYVQLLDRISQNQRMKIALLRNNRPHTAAVTELTREDLPQLRSRLKEAVNKKSIQDGHGENTSHTNSFLLNTSPSVASWVQRRPTMTWDFYTSGTGHSVPIVPSVSQENILIEDLLNAFIGLPGNYIEAEELRDIYGPRSFRINDNVSLPLRELTKQILPLASHYSIIQRFIEEKMKFEFGQVNNALAEAMQSIIKEHMLFTIQLESEFKLGNLTLQKLWFYVQKNLQSLSVVANIASVISKSDGKGGKVLSLLHDRVISSIGDDRTQELCLKLMEAACFPYMKMLGMWIYKGIISDPIKEFLVEDNEIVQREEMPVDYSTDYWEKKYAIRRERIPVFLEPVADIIIKTGKYLNVIRQCGKQVDNKVLPIHYKIEEKHYIEAIEKAYKFASQTLLDLIIKEQDLIGRLKSVKHYFLLDQGDFIVTFLTLCEKELVKYSIDVNQGCIESLMDLALRMCSANNDPYKDDLRIDLLPQNLEFQMFKILSIQTNAEQEFKSSHTEQKKLLLIQSFSFNYDVRWPLSLILNRKSLACYQMIFRHLFYCKYVERLICQVWKSNKVAKKFHFDDAQHYRAAFALRQRMLHCIQNLEYHMMVEVIEPHWCTFMNKIHKVQNVDEILCCHSDFLDSCLKDCMLTIPPILSTINKLLNICEDFCKFMQQTQRYFVEAELGSLPNSMYESFTQNELVFQGNSDPGAPALSFKQKISKFDISFSEALIQLLDGINELNRDTSEHERLFNLLYRLDFNMYYHYSGQSHNHSMFFESSG